VDQLVAVVQMIANQKKQWQLPAKWPGQPPAGSEAEKVRGDSANGESTLQEQEDNIEYQDN